jgi:catechol-2,3-dioxygenase
MNTETIVHPRLQHIALATGNMDAMIAWYRTVVGMNINHRRAAKPDPSYKGPPFGAAWISNDEVHQRIALFEFPRLAVDSDKQRHTHMHHFAFQYETLEDLLGTYARLKALDIVPAVAVDEGVQISFYYDDPDKNRVELNVGNFRSEWTAGEYMKNEQRMQRAEIDPDKMLEALKAGASAWELHERALAGEFAPAKPYVPA